MTDTEAIYRALLELKDDVGETKGDVKGLQKAISKIPCLTGQPCPQAQPALAKQPFVKDWRVWAVACLSLLLGTGTGNPQLLILAKALIGG